MPVKKNTSANVRKPNPPPGSRTPKSGFKGKPFFVSTAGRGVRGPTAR